MAQDKAKKASPFATSAQVETTFAGLLVRFDGIPAAEYRVDMKRVGGKYAKPINAWVLPQTAEASQVAHSIPARMKEYADAHKAAAQAANVTAPAPSKTRGRKSAAHRNLEQVLGKTLSKVQFEQLQSIIK